MISQELLVLIKQDVVQVKRGTPESRDLVVVTSRKNKEMTWKDFRSDDALMYDSFLWLPLPIDPINPERGVWNWIDWCGWSLAVFQSGDLYAYNKFGCMVTFEGDPLTVLLKVFLYQQGIKERGN